MSDLLKDIFEDLSGSLIEISPDENIFLLQPCRDNTLYLLKLIDDLLVSESGIKLLVKDDHLIYLVSDLFIQNASTLYIFVRASSELLLLGIKS